MASTALPPVARPIVRGQAPEAPEVPPTGQVVVAAVVPAIPPTGPQMMLPSPEQLGIARPRPTDDGTTALARLERLGATCFRLERTASGHRITCLMPGAGPDQVRRFEAEAATPAEAVRLVLDRAEAWVARR